MVYEICGLPDVFLTGLFLEDKCFSSLPITPPRNVGQIENGLERGFIKSHRLNSVKNY